MRRPLRDRRNPLPERQAQRPANWPAEGYKENAMTEALRKDSYTDCVRREWRRLVKDAYHGLEFQTSLHFLEEHLPQKGLVLDAGGGPGRYAIELARKGLESCPATQPHIPFCQFNRVSSRPTACIQNQSFRGRCSSRKSSVVWNSSPW